jgi:hypothetical protein
MHGHATRVAYEPFNALTVAAEFRPQVAILEVNMPSTRLAVCVRGPRKATTSGAREALWLVPLHLNQGLRKLSQSFIEPFGFGKRHEL